MFVDVSSNLRGNVPARLTILSMMTYRQPEDVDAAKGAVEVYRPEDVAETNMAKMDAQLDHRFQDPMNKSFDAGMAETGQTPEYSMERQGENELLKDTGDYKRDRGSDADAEADMQDQDPGDRQKRNQQNEEDPLAA